MGILLIIEVLSNRADGNITGSNRQDSNRHYTYIIKKR